MPKYDIDFEIKTSGRVTIEAANRDEAVSHLNMHARMIMTQNMRDLEIRNVEIESISGPEE